MARTRRKKKRTHRQEANVAVKGDPKTFVLKRGKHAGMLSALQQDLRQLLLPNTADKLKERKGNVLKDFLNVAGPLGVTHLLVLSATEHASYIKVARVPRGPTISFKIEEFSLMRDIASALSRPKHSKQTYINPPLLVLSGFKGERHLELAATLFQAMFPTISVANVKLSMCKRVVLIQYDKNSGYIEWRHYAVTCAPSGVSKALKQLLHQRKVPQLGEFDDVSEFIMKSGYGSESETEEAAEQRVTLSQTLGRGNIAQHKSRVRLHELGPRLTLQIVKIEEGLAEGKVLYHSHIHKSVEEQLEQETMIQEHKKLKEQRRKEQEENVERKKQDVANRKAAQALKLQQQQQQYQLDGEKATKAAQNDDGDIDDDNEDDDDKDGGGVDVEMGDGADHADSDDESDDDSDEDDDDDVGSDDASD